MSKRGLTDPTMGSIIPLLGMISMSFKALKKEFLCVEPKSSDARDIFQNEMSLLHSCKVEGRKDGMVFLSSISGRYRFYINEDNDSEWLIVK